MAKFKLQAGAFIDTLTQPEIAKTLTQFITSWRLETQRGDTYRHFSATGTADASGNLVIGGSDATRSGLGPEESMVWGVSRIAVTGAAGTTPILSLFRNSADPSTIIRGSLALVNGNAYQEYGSPGLVLNPGTNILLTGTALTAGSAVTLTGDCRELPASMLWRMAGQ